MEIRQADLWRFHPVGMLGHPGVATLISVLFFVISSRFRWGVDWAWHFLATFALFALCLWLGRLGTERLFQNNLSQWLMGLPPSFDELVFVLYHRGAPGDVSVLSLVYEDRPMPTRAFVEELLADADASSVSIRNYGYGRIDIAWSGPRILLPRQMQRLTQRALIPLCVAYPWVTMSVFEVQPLLRPERVAPGSIAPARFFSSVPFFAYSTVSRRSPLAPQSEDFARYNVFRAGPNAWLRDVTP